MRLFRGTLLQKIPFKRSMLVLLSGMLLAWGPAASLRADTYDDQIDAIQQQVNQFQSQANDLHAQADTLQNALSALEAQQNELLAEISQKQVELQKLEQQIQDTNTRIDNEKSALALNLRSMYIESDTSPLEMIASSKSIGDYIDKQEYRTSIRDAIQKGLTEIKALKADLEKQQTAVKQTLDEKQGAENELAAQAAEKDKLLADTQGQEAAYQNLISQKKSEIAILQEQQRAAFAARFGTGFHSSGSYGSLEYKNLTPNVPCGGGYPSYLCAATQDSLVDEWDLYNRECVSYVAWAATYKYGKNNPVLNSSDPSVRGFNGHGNAGQWPDYLNGRYGTVVDETPTAGSVVVIPPQIIGGVGHAAVVESVNGQWMHVSQYNWAPVDGKYSEMDLKIVPGLAFVHF